MSSPNATARAQRVTGNLKPVTRREGVVWYIRSRVPGREPYETMTRLAPAHLGGGRCPTGSMTRKMAADELRDYLSGESAKVSSGEYAQPARAVVTFGAVADAWLAVKQHEVGEQTWTDYKAVLRNHLRPAFGDDAVHDLESRRVLDYIAAKRADGCGARSLERQVVVLHAVLGHAVAHHGVARNVADADLLGSARPRAKIDPDAYNTLTGEQVAAIADEMPTPEGRAAVLIAFWSGARKGELVELRWRDVLWSDGQLRIARAYNGRTRGVGTTKGGTGRRVPLSPALAKQLDDLAPDDAQPDALIVTDEHGQRLNGFTLLRHFRTAIKAAGLAHLLDGSRPLNWHDLRHSFCSAAVRVADVTRVQAWAGHANLSTTQRYLHASPVEGEAAALGSALGQSTGEPVAA